MSLNTQSEKHWMKAELHSHCSLDPIDYHICQYPPEELISNAAKLGYEILAITCHNIDIWNNDLSDYARSLGITLIPGMEVITERTRHALVYNFHAEAEHLNTLEKIHAFSREDTLVIAPHPFYPGSSCLNELLEKNLDLFDAIEFSGFHVHGGIDFNRRGESLAATRNKPIVGNGDIHFLWQLGKTFTWIYSEPGVQPILNAVKQGFVRVEKSPLTWLEAAEWWAINYWRRVFPANPAPYRPGMKPSLPAMPLNKIENGRCLGAAQEGMEP